jgi:arylsulfatase A-like enzyme
LIGALPFSLAVRTTLVRTSDGEPYGFLRLHPRPVRRGWQSERSCERLGACFSKPQALTHPREANWGNEYNTGFFSSEYYADNLINYFKERSEEDKEKPFFAFLPFSAPHWPLQCSMEDRMRYRGKYDDGPTALRERRVANLKELAPVGKDVVPHQVIPEDTAHAYHAEWEDMKEDERKKSARAMECFAGMVDNMDQNIGTVLDYLDSTGEGDSACFCRQSCCLSLICQDTVVLFMSDNGAEGAVFESYPLMGRDLMAVLKRYYNNQLDNIGNHDS